MKTALVKLKDEAFASAASGAAGRQALLAQYTAAFRQAEQGARDGATTALKTLSKSVSEQVAPEARAAIVTKIDTQVTKLA
jgi:hypothetical protein